MSSPTDPVAQTIVSNSSVTIAAAPAAPVEVLVYAGLDGLFLDVDVAATAGASFLLPAGAREVFPLAPGETLTAIRSASGTIVAHTFMSRVEQRRS